MPKRRFLPIFLTILAATFLVFIIWLIHEANIGRDNILFQSARATPYGDKIGHFFLAGTFTLVANFLLRNRNFTLRGIPLFYGSLIVLILAAAEESSQYFISTRTLDVKDALANVAGILVFSIPAFFKAKRDRCSS